MEDGNLLLVVVVDIFVVVVEVVALQISNVIFVFIEATSPNYPLDFFIFL